MIGVGALGEAVRLFFVAPLQQFASELAISATDPSVIRSIIVSLIVGGICLLVGTSCARRFGVLRIGAPAGETIGVGLGSGVLVVSTIWAVIWSGGRSSFTPVAIALAIAIAMTFWRPSAWRPNAPSSSDLVVIAKNSTRHQPLAPAVILAAIFVVVMGLVYGATMAPSPRDDSQPVEFQDEAFYSVLGRDLAMTGTETIYSPSGFGQISGLSSQNWYHWGEMWLAAATITVFGVDVTYSRHYVVLPLLLLACVALTGTVVRRLAGTRSRGAFLFGGLACLFLAPVPIQDTFFSGWPVGLIFGITTYGVSAIVVLLVLFRIADSPPETRTLPSVLFWGAVIASIIPAHIVMALLATVGVGAAATARVASAYLSTRRLPRVGGSWKGIVVAAVAVTAVTVIWGFATGHGIGASGLAEQVAPFNPSWQRSVALTAAGSGVFLAIPIVLRKPGSPGMARSVVIGTLALLLAGAIGWGARLGDFTTFHLLYGGIAVFGAPVAAVACCLVWRELRAGGHRRLGIAGLVVAGAQLVVGMSFGFIRLQQFGPAEFEPISTTLLDAIRQLPADAKVAYSCHGFQELAFWDPKLISIDAHTARRVVPMCFEPDFYSWLNGAELTPTTESPLYSKAPQRMLYPNAEAHPSADAIVAFMRGYGIDYIYADAVHPNTLIPDARLIFGTDRGQLLAIP